IKVVSWNLMGLERIAVEARTSAALDHLRERFGESPSHLIIMFQEVTSRVIRAIMDHPWAQRHFILSNIEGPVSRFHDTPGSDSFVLREIDWQAGHYCTLILVSRALPILDCFRVPLTTRMARDVLVVDIWSDSAQSNSQHDVLRLCTTHLESLYDKPGMYRPGQLARISDILKGVPGVPGSGRVIGGLVGGDMNSIEKEEHEYHRAPEIVLNDVWEDIPPPSPPVLKPFKKDLTYGRDRGNTWGYQSKGPRGRKRLDKFFYTGSLLTVPVAEAQDTVGRLGRMGVGLKTEADVWELDLWVSDHFAITVGIKVRAPHVEQGALGSSP
ncbi:Endonuclease/exonuclease/phosphatase, partial [Lasiosphaeria hispida]